MGLNYLFDVDKLAKTAVDEAAVKIVPPLQEAITGAVKQLLDGIDGLEVHIVITKKKEGV